jgi:hypothetical protein
VSWWSAASSNCGYSSAQRSPENSIVCPKPARDFSSTPARHVEYQCQPKDQSLQKFKPSHPTRLKLINRATRQPWHSPGCPDALQQRWFRPPMSPPGIASSRRPRRSSETYVPGTERLPPNTDVRTPMHARGARKGTRTIFVSIFSSLGLQPATTAEILLHAEWEKKRRGRGQASEREEGLTATGLLRYPPLLTILPPT